MMRGDMMKKVFQLLGILSLAGVLSGFMSMDEMLASDDPSDRARGEELAVSYVTAARGEATVADKLAVVEKMHDQRRLAAIAAAKSAPQEVRKAARAKLTEDDGFVELAALGEDASDIVDAVKHLKADRSRVTAAELLAYRGKTYFAKMALENLGAGGSALIAERIVQLIAEEKEVARRLELYPSLKSLQHTYKANYEAYKWMCSQAKPDGRLVALANDPFVKQSKGCQDYDFSRPLTDIRVAAVVNKMDLDKLIDEGVVVDGKRYALSEVSRLVKNRKGLNERLAAANLRYYTTHREEQGGDLVRISSSVGGPVVDEMGVAVMDCQYSSHYAAQWNRGNLWFFDVARTLVSKATKPEVKAGILASSLEQMAVIQEKVKSCYNGTSIWGESDDEQLKKVMTAWHQVADRATCEAAAEMLVFKGRKGADYLLIGAPAETKAAIMQKLTAVTQNRLDELTQELKTVQASFGESAGLVEAMRLGKKFDAFENGKSEFTTELQVKKAFVGKSICFGVHVNDVCEQGDVLVAKVEKLTVSTSVWTGINVDNDIFRLTIKDEGLKEAAVKWNVLDKVYVCATLDKFAEKSSGYLAYLTVTAILSESEYKSLDEKATRIDQLEKEIADLQKKS